MELLGSGIANMAAPGFVHSQSPKTAGVAMTRASVSQLSRCSRVAIIPCSSSELAHMRVQNSRMPLERGGTRSSRMEISSSFSDMLKHSDPIDRACVCFEAAIPNDCLMGKCSSKSNPKLSSTFQQFAPTMVTNISKSPPATTVNIARGLGIIGA
jgi:hypothetical protein